MNRSPFATPVSGMCYHVLSHFPSSDRNLRLRIRSRQSSKPSKQSWKCWTSSRWKHRHTARVGVYKQWKTGSIGSSKMGKSTDVHSVCCLNWAHHGCQKNYLPWSAFPTHVLKYHEKIGIGTQTSHAGEKTIFLFDNIETAWRSCEKQSTCAWCSAWSQLRRRRGRRTVP